jgi:predicted MFS family arabinose efflux permease
MTSLVFGFVRAAANGWGDRLTVTSFVASAALLSAFVLTEKRAQQPITPLRLFSSRERAGAYGARVLVVSGMYSMFFFVTQFFQEARQYSPLKSGLAFLPVTLVMFAVVRAVPRVASRLGTVRLLTGGVLVALLAMAWLSRISLGTSYFPDIAVPLALLGIGIGAALTPLTAAGVAGVAPDDAGAAAGLVNVAQQLGGSLGLGILVTLFAGASRTSRHGASADVSARLAAQHLAHAISTSLTGSATFLAMALVVVTFVMRRPAALSRLAAERPVGNFNAGPLQASGPAFPARSMTSFDFSQQQSLDTEEVRCS